MNEVASQQVRVAFYDANAKVELLEPTAPESPIASYLAKTGGGMHHLSIAVTDFDARIMAIRAAGLRLIPEEPILGAEGRRVIFVHPKSASGVLIELMEADESKHTPRR